MIGSFFMTVTPLNFTLHGNFITGKTLH